MQSTKARESPKESPQKVSPRPARQLKINPAENTSTSSSNHAAAVRTPKTRSPNVIERKSPRSPFSEKKRPSKMSELESQITQLQDDLKKVKGQLVISESSKKEAQEDAEQVKKKLADVSLKLEESQKQVSMLVASKEANFFELQNISQEKDQEWDSQIESARKQQSVKSDALVSGHDEIQKLQQRLEMVAVSQDEQGNQRESTNDELQCMKSNLAETLTLVEIMKIELKDCKESEAQAKDLVRETLHQLEAAKETVNILRSDVNRSKEAYSCVVSELEQSRARINLLEGIVSKLNALEVSQLESELQATRSDFGQLKSAMEAADLRYNEEQSQNKEHMRNVSELLEEIKTKSSQREAELQAELKKASVDVEELKAKLMDKETELQGISEENESLNMKLEKSMPSQREQELENELKELRQHVAEIKANVMDKETELQNIREENETLKLEIKNRETDKVDEKDNVVAEVEASQAAEQDAMAKIGYMKEEVDKSKRRAMRITEQLEAAQAANAEMEAELRRLKVQTDQWRKAAEAAASMLSPVSNGKCVERTGSMPVENNYSPIGARLGSPYLDDFDEDSFKKKNGNVLKKIGVLWKKPQK